MKQICLLVCLLSPSLLLAKLDFNGQYLSDLFIGHDDPYSSDFIQQNNELWLEADVREDKTYLKTQILFTFPSASIDPQREENLETVIREGFGTYLGKDWAFSAGKKILRWGKTEAISPLDVWRGERSYLISGDSDRLFTGAPMLELNWRKKKNERWCIRAKRIIKDGKKRLQCVKYETRENISRWKIDLALSLDTADAPIPTNVLGLPNFYSIDENVDEISGLKSSEKGLRISYLAQKYDLSLILFEGYTHRSFFQERSRSLSGLNAAATNPHYSLIGLSWSRAFNNFSVNGEFASKHYFANLIPDSKTFILGLSSNAITNLTILAQPFYITYSAEFDLTNDPLIIPLQTINQVLYRLQNKTQSGAVLRLTYENPESEWSYELQGIYYLDSKEIFSQFRLSNNISSKIRLSLGTIYNSGPVGTTADFASFQNAYFFEGLLWF